MHCKTPEAVLTHPSIHMKTTFANVQPNPAIVCVVGPAAVVTFPFNSRQAAWYFVQWVTSNRIHPNFVKSNFGAIFF